MRHRELPDGVGEEDQGHRAARGQHIQRPPDRERQQHEEQLAQRRVELQDVGASRSVSGRFQVFQVPFQRGNRGKRRVSGAPQQLQRYIAKRKMGWIAISREYKSTWLCAGAAPLSMKS